MVIARNNKMKLEKEDADKKKKAATAGAVLIHCASSSLPDTPVTPPICTSPGCDTSCAHILPLPCRAAAKSKKQVNVDNEFDDANLAGGGNYRSVDDDYDFSEQSGRPTQQPRLC